MTSNEGRKVFAGRSLVSFLVALSCAVVTLSGALLYSAPTRRVACWTGWSVMGLGRAQWRNVHMAAALLFAIAACLHLWYNWRVFWGYIRSKATAGVNRKWELLAATVLTAAVIGGTIANIPPMNAIAVWFDDIKTFWDGRVTTRPPRPHAELMTLQHLAQYVGLTARQAADAIAAEGHEVTDTGLALRVIAGQNGVSPMKLFAAVVKHHPQAAEKRRGRGMRRGLGRRSERARENAP